jgi:predicted HicB family RNase H-like nuclease
VSTLHYKGYQGSVEFEDGRLVLQILHITDFISGECNAAGDAQTAFKTLVDDYLAACEEAGKQPDKPFKGSFNVRVSPDLHRQAAMAAADVGVSLNAFVEKAITKALEAPASFCRTA